MKNWERALRMSGRFLASLILMIVMVFGDLFTIPEILSPYFSAETASAAQVTIDSATHATGASHSHSGSQTVFTSDLTGYKFYRDSLGDCVYSKTTDGGDVWGAAVQIDSQTDCLAISVWYDRWTPNDTGDFIHIATIDSGNDDIFYNRLDTANSDTRLTGAAAVTTNDAGARAGTYVLGSNYPTISKATDGKVYVAINDSSLSYILQCAATCNTPSNWTTVGTSPLDNVDGDYNILMPLVNAEMMIINRDVSLEDMRSRIWNGTNWGAAWIIIDATATDNITYDVGFSATLASSTAAATTTIYLAYIADNATLGTDDDIRTARYAAGVWTARGNVLTNDTKGLTSVAIARDQVAGSIYVAYTGATNPVTLTTANTYWKASTDDMSSWGTQQGPLNTSSDNYFGVDLNIMSDERIYASWYDLTDADIYGDTLVDLVNGVRASSTGTQVSPITAATSSFHIGGAFSIAEQASSRNVTAITITENGTIDGANNISNIQLLYEMDSVAPYDCASVSYGGSETQFGSTDANGFSGADGISAFSGSSVAVSTTSAMCVYVVLDILDSTSDNTTLDVSIANPSTDITVSNSGSVIPATAVGITGSTTVRNDLLTQTHFHWRNDTGIETASLSRTSGVEDTNLSAIQQNTPVRLRLQVSNEGGTTSPSTAFRLEYSVATSTCAAADLWTDVDAANDDWNMSPSAFYVDGANTTNISVANGGVTDENTTFLASNAGLKDTSSTVTSTTLSSTTYMEMEFAVVASTSAAEGNTYCFRVSSSGTALPSYLQYGRASIAADTSVSATSTQIATADIPTSNVYIGGAYVIVENSSSRNVTSITITENGSVDAQTNIDNIRLRYDLDVTAPYDCASESYGGAELQFGAIDTDGFSSADGASTFTGTVAISTTTAMCVYTILDIVDTAVNGETLNVVINNPSVDVVTSGGGSVSPSATRDITGVTALSGAVLTQSRYHWRNDDGSETLATSATGDIEATVLDPMTGSTPQRLRIEVSNEGATTSPSTSFRLEYGTKVTSCSAVSSWIDVGATDGAFDMSLSSNIVEGGNTTNIAISAGGVTDDNTTFLIANAGLKDSSSLVATTTLSSTTFMEMEFSIVASTTLAGYDTVYCFRLAKGTGVALDAYTLYPEIVMASKRDFKVQRGTTTVTGNSTTITAGVDYVAPAASTSAFIRITNSHHTGAGNTNGGNNNQAPDDVTAYILDPWNIGTSITFTRPTGAANTTRVSWEILEYIGLAGGDNEFIVRQQQAITYGTAATSATSSEVSEVVNATDIVVFISGQLSPDTTLTNYDALPSTSSWASSTSQAVFTRGVSGGDAVIVSYAVVEFTGLNWAVQRAEHTYASAGAAETESITTVNSISQTFLHTQKRTGSGLNGMDEFGAEVWLSSVGAVTFQLQAGAGIAANMTSVVWIIENMQTGVGAMLVTRSSGNSNGGVEPLTVSVSIGVTVDALNNSSIFITNRAVGTGTNFPRPIIGAALASTTHYAIFRSDTGSAVDYRTEVVEWPTAALTYRQNIFQFYADNNALLPTDFWPPGAASIGENATISVTDQPLGQGDTVRIRLSIKVKNASMPASTKAFKLQFGTRSTTCTAVTTWTDAGQTASSTIWRGYDAAGITDGTALSIDPPAGGDLVLTGSDVAGTIEETNDTVVNPHTADENEDVEYDWLVEQNGATGETFYCFRMVEADGTVFQGYDNYPQIRTASFAPSTQNWRWYDDENNVTPTIALANENVSPTDVGNQDVVKLRVTVKETKNIANDNARFKLQYSESPAFTTATDLASTTLCTATSTWCYADGGGVDNGIIPSKVLSDADACSGGVGNGCGTHNESPNNLTGFRHEGNAATEYEFTIRQAAARAGAVYYFRLFDVAQGVAVSTNTGESYPSVTTEGATLVFSVAGVATSTVIEGVTTDVGTTPNAIPFGSFTSGITKNAAFQVSVDTNSTEGYSVFLYSRQGLVANNGDEIDPITASNTAPTAWATACGLSQPGCFGYHAGDDTLSGGSTRFSPDDSFAALEMVPREVAQSSVPVNETVTVVYRLGVKQLQSAGQYQTELVYIVVPVF